MSNGLLTSFKMAPVRLAAALCISVIPVPYMDPPIEHLKNSIKFRVKVPVLSENIYSICKKIKLALPS